MTDTHSHFILKKSLILIGLTLFLLSCSSNRGDRVKEKKPTITVSILPQKYFIEKIAGKSFNIQVLVPPGTGPETYTLVPSQLKEISTSQIWFLIGHLAFEEAWINRISEVNRTISTVDLSEGLNLIKGEKIKHGDHYHPGGIDPHTWLSPPLVREMAEKITTALTKAFPERAAEFRNNYNNFIAEIDLLDLEIRTMLTPYKGRAVITFHPSISYFAKEYGLNLLSLESEGKDPTPQLMAEIINTAHKESIHTIYIQREFDKDHARVFAEEINGKIEEIEPLAEEWSENLRRMTKLIIDNFQ